MANATVTVEASGGDYTTLNAALSGESADLTANCSGTGGAGILTIQCGNFEDTTPASTGTGYTTSSSYYINIIGDPADIAAGTTGKWSTSRYRLAPASGATLTIREAHTKCLDLQVASQSDAGTYAKAIVCDDAITGFLFDRCVVKDGNPGQANRFGFDVDDSQGTIRNCIIYDCSGTSADGVYVGYSGTSGGVLLQNCTIVNCTNGVVTAYNACKAQNVLTQDCADGFNGTFYQSDYNASDVASDAPGANSRNGTDGTVTFADAGADDYHLASGDSNAINHGTDLSGTFTDDIDGDTRSSWDIGADEYVAAAVASILRQMIAHHCG